MAQYQLIWCHDPKQHQLWMNNFADSLPCFGRLKPKNEVGVAQIGHQELVSHHIITHWIHMDDMKWLSIN